MSPGYDFRAPTLNAPTPEGEIIRQVANPTEQALIRADMEMHFKLAQTTHDPLMQRYHRRRARDMRELLRRKP